MRAFGEAEVADYLDGRLPGAGLPEGLAATLAARTGGSPLFLEKTVDAWIDDGRASTTGPGGRSRPRPRSCRADVPSTCAADPPAPGSARRDDRRALETASVAAPAFSAAAVAAGLRASPRPRSRSTGRVGASRRHPRRRRRGAVAGRHGRGALRVHARPPPRGALRRHAGRPPRTPTPRDRRAPRGGPRGRDHAIATELANHFVRGRDPARRATPRHRRGAGGASARPAGGSHALPTPPCTPWASCRLRSRRRGSCGSPSFAGWR